VDKAELIDLARKNAMLKSRLDDLNSEMSDIKQKINEGIDQFGIEDDRGHIIVEIDDTEVSGVSRVMRQRRVAKNLDMFVAEQVLREKGLYDKCVTMLPVLDESEIMAAYYNEELTEEDIDKMFPSRVSYALVIK
jgi:stress-induced morphogen